jgi:ribonuclease E
LSRGRRRHEREEHRREGAAEEVGVDGQVTTGAPVTEEGQEGRVPSGSRRRRRRAWERRRERLRALHEQQPAAEGEPAAEPQPEMVETRPAEEAPVPTPVRRPRRRRIAPPVEESVPEVVAPEPEPEPEPILVVETPPSPKRTRTKKTVVAPELANGEAIAEPSPEKPKRTRAKKAVSPEDANGVLAAQPIAEAAPPKRTRARRAKTPAAES